MVAVSKHAAVVFGLSLAASTASASIPDANGVIHGCYNALTGSTRIIDGNNCGFLEKAITWAQTGPRGPAGPTGPSGENVTGTSLPVGDANCPAGGVALTLSGNTSYVCNVRSAEAVYMGWETLEFGPQAANTEKFLYTSARPFLPTDPAAVCVYNYAASFQHPVPGVALTPKISLNDAQGSITLSYATVTFPELTGQNVVSTATTAGWNIHPFEELSPGMLVRTGADPIPAGSSMKVTVTWTCSGGPNRAAF